MSIDLAFQVAPGLLGDDLTFTTNAVAITPAAGSELLANGGFGAWTGDNPDSWTVSGESGGDPAVHQTAPDEDHTGSGSGAANLYTSATAYQPYAKQTALTVGEWYQLSVVTSKFTAGVIAVSDDLNAMRKFISSAATTVWTGRATHTKVAMGGNAAGTDITVDSASVRALSALVQLFAHPQAWGDFSVSFTIPAASYQAGIVFNVQDASNFMHLYFDRLDGKVYLTKRIGGTVTQIGVWSASYIAGKTLTARRHRDGTLDVIYNGATLASGLAASGLAGKQAGPFLTDAGGVTLHRYTWDARSVA